MTTAPAGAPDLAVSARNLSRHYQISGGLFRPETTVRALQEASFDLRQGETLAVVGESGCGKSTLARVVTMIEPPTGGSLATAAQRLQVHRNTVKYRVARAHEVRGRPLGGADNDRLDLELALMACAWLEPPAPAG